MANVVNTQKPVLELSAPVQNAVSFLSEKLAVAKTFGEISDILPEAKVKFAEEMDSENILVVDGTRLAYALDVYVNTEKGYQPVRIYRTEEIKFDEKTPAVNLQMVDAIIASRPLLPSGNYGLLGKAANTRGKPELYENLEVSVLVNKDVAYEVNEETGEHCAMVCAIVMVQNPSAEFIEALKTSAQIQIVSNPEAKRTAKIFFN